MPVNLSKEEKNHNAVNTKRHGKKSYKTDEMLYGNPVYFHHIQFDQFIGTCELCKHGFMKGQSRYGYQSMNNRYHALVFRWYHVECYKKVCSK